MRQRSTEHTEKAISLDPQNPIAHTCLGWAIILTGPQDRAVHHLRRALELDPNLTMAWSGLGAAYGFLGKSSEAMAAIENAKRGSPRDPLSWHWHLSACIAHFSATRLEQAVSEAHMVIEAQPNWYGSYPLLAASAAHLGRMDMAREAVATLLTIVPRFSMKGVERNPMFEFPEDARRMIEGLRLAGLAE